jgi:hypothetical protein
MKPLPVPIHAVQRWIPTRNRTAISRTATLALEHENRESSVWIARRRDLGRLAPPSLHSHPVFHSRLSREVAMKRGRNLQTSKNAYVFHRLRRAFGLGKGARLPQILSLEGPASRRPFSFWRKIVLWRRIVARRHPGTWPRNLSPASGQKLFQGACVAPAALAKRLRSYYVRRVSRDTASVHSVRPDPPERPAA